MNIVLCVAGVWLDGPEKVACDHKLLGNVKETKGDDIQYKTMI